MIIDFITCRTKLLNADWLRQRAFFLNQEGTFGNQEGMITWCWLAEHACIAFPLQTEFEKEFQKRIASEFDLNTVISSQRERKSTRNKAQSFGGKAKGLFRPKTYSFAAWKQFEWGRLVSNEALDRTSWPPKLKVNFFVLLRVALLVLQT